MRDVAGQVSSQPFGQLNQVATATGLYVYKAGWLAKDELNLELKVDSSSSLVLKRRHATENQGRQVGRQQQ